MAKSKSTSNASRPAASTKPRRAGAPVDDDTAAPFPFVGAGNARYFEWAEVHVWFARAPRPAERKQISAGVPVPLADSVAFDGQHLAVASAQGVGRHIEAAYARPPKQPSGLTASSRFKMAGTGRVARFNADIERWLLEAHAVVPIAVAFRGQDAEAGGTVLSEWHAVSIPQIPALLKLIGKPKKDAGAWYLVEGLKYEHGRARRG